MDISEVSKARDYLDEAICKLDVLIRTYPSVIKIPLAKEARLQLELSSKKLNEFIVDYATKLLKEKESIYVNTKQVNDNNNSNRNVRIDETKHKLNKEYGKVGESNSEDSVSGDGDDIPETEDSDEPEHEDIDEPADIVE